MSAASGGSPMALWEMLEHGEKVECLYLHLARPAAPVLRLRTPRPARIAAWWLPAQGLRGLRPRRGLRADARDDLADRPDPRFAAPSRRTRSASSSLRRGLPACATRSCPTATRGSVPPPRRRSGGSTAMAGARSARRSATPTRPSSSPRSQSPADQRFSTCIRWQGSTVDPTRSGAQASDRGPRRPQLRRPVAAVEAAASNDPDAGVRAEACHALGTFGDSSCGASCRAGGERSERVVRDEAQNRAQRL